MISDVGQAPCRLQGPARITGLDRAGRPVTNTYTSRVATISPATTAPVILSPLTGPVPDGLAALYGFPPPPGGLAGAITLRDNYGPAPNMPAGASCRPNWVVPAAWRVVIGGLSRTVPNTDPAGPDPIVPSGAFVTCGGSLYSDLTYYGLLTY